MNTIELEAQKLIEDLCNWKITKKEFETKIAFKANYKQLNELLLHSKQYCKEENTNKYFYSIFWNLPNNLSLSENLKIYREYLLVKWHHEHEEIVGTFQIIFNDNKENITVLLDAISKLPKYLQSYDFKYPYIRKIIYAIGAQPEPYNIEALEKLSNETNDDEIRDLALHQIKKRKELGRWEFKKNTESES